MGLRDKHVNGRHNKKRESGADDHSTYQHDADAVSCSSAWTLSKNQREMAANRGRRCHENGAQSRAGRADNRLQFTETGFLQMIPELDD